jgi:hypothetical protein
VSRQRGYQLIAMATVMERIQSVVALPDNYGVSDRDARKIMSVGIETFVEAVEQQSGQDGDANAKLVQALARELTAVPRPVVSLGQAQTPERMAQTPALVSATERKAATLVSITTAFSYQARNLPSVEELNEESAHNVIPLLREAVSVAQTRLDSFNSVLARMEGVADVA